MATSQRKLSFDTSVIIALQHGGILFEILRLPAEWAATNLVLDEVKYPDTQIVGGMLSRGVRSVSLSGEEVEELSSLSERYIGPSRVDISALVYATRYGTTLLTGDKNLRSAADMEEVDCHGTLWILDESIKASVLTPEQAAVALQTMIKSGTWLPRRECESRLSQWR